MFFHEDFLYLLPSSLDCYWPLILYHIQNLSAIPLICHIHFNPTVFAIFICSTIITPLYENVSINTLHDHLERNIALPTLNRRVVFLAMRQ